MTVWFPACSAATNCVQVGWTDVGEPVTVRSSRREGQVISIDPDEWADFIAKVKAGEFDHTT